MWYTEADCPTNKWGKAAGKIFLPAFSGKGELALDSFLCCALFLNQNINILLTAAWKEAEVG